MERWIGRTTCLALLALLSLTSCLSGEENGNAPGQGIDGDSLDTPDTSRLNRKPGFTEDYNHANRGIWQKPELVIDLLGDLSDKTVADIGAGSGFFTFRLTPLAKKVIAIDIDPRFIAYLDSVKVHHLPGEGTTRLETRLATPSDPHLKPGEADVVVIVNTYMYLKDRVAYLRNLRQGIADGGVLLIVDFKKKRTPIGPPAEFRIPLFQAEEELHEAGYSSVETNDTALDYQYIILSHK